MLHYNNISWLYKIQVANREIEIHGRNLFLKPINPLFLRGKFEMQKVMASQTTVATSVWNDFKDEHWRQDQSHWRGIGRWQDDEKWKKIGKNSLMKINRIVSFLGKSHDFWLKKYTFLEWGGGGGANPFVLANFSSEYFDVDISEKNLNESERILQNENFFSFKKVLITEPNDVLSQISIPIDIFLSTAVFQHFPSKEYACSVLDVLAKLSHSNTIGFIQIRFDNGNPKFKPIDNINDYYKNHIYACSFSIDEFNDILIKFGFQVLFISDISTKNNYVTFYIKKNNK